MILQFTPVGAWNSVQRGHLSVWDVILRVFALHIPSLLPLPASSLITFLQPAYSHSRFDKLAKIPVLREIIDNGKSQVTYRTRDLTAKNGRVRLLLLALAGRRGTQGWEKANPGVAEEGLWLELAGREGAQGLRSAQGKTFPSMPCFLAGEDLRGCLRQREPATLGAVGTGKQMGIAWGMRESSLGVFSWILWAGIMES